MEAPSAEKMRRLAERLRIAQFQILESRESPSFKLHRSAHSILTTSGKRVEARENL